MARLNVTAVTIDKVKNNLKKYYLQAIRTEYELRKLRSVFLWSSPGIGKSEMCRQIAEELQEETGYKVEFRDIRLSECTILELLGLMHRDPVTNQVLYDKPPIYDTDGKETIIVFLFDEMDKATKELQKAALHLVLEKRYWQHELPENSIVIAAGNPENIGGEMYSKFAPELNNRFRHFLIRSDFPAWKTWAQKNGVNAFVVKFLQANQHLLYGKDAGTEHTAFNTPRSWMQVSEYLNLMYPDGNICWEDAYVDVLGDVGEEIAPQFRKYCMTEGLMPDAEDIVNGRVKTVPRQSDVKDAVLRSLSTYLYTMKDKISGAQWSFVWEYVNRFPVEYGVLFYRYLADMNVHRIMLENLNRDQHSQWMKKYGASVNFKTEF